jgi:hypothetical protein
MKWSKLVTVAVVALMSAALVAQGQLPPQKTDKGEATYVKVEIKGLLKTGVMAIGGETTGTTITAGTMTFELDFGKNKEFRELAEKLNGKTAIAHGTLNIRKGVEVKLRSIVTVTDLKAGE